MTTATPNTNALIRGLGLIAAISIVVGNVIGTGVFLKTRVMTCNVGTPSLVIAVWIGAGLLSLAGALTYAELSAMMPKAGGEYVFVREAYGARMGFLYGWMQFFIAKAGGLAAISIGFAIFLNALTNGALGGNYFTLDLHGYQFVLGKLQVVAVGMILFATLINCAAVSVNGQVATLLMVIKVLLVLAVGIGAFIFAQGDWTHFAQINAGGACEGVNASARVGLAGFGAAMLGALWAYNGWNELTFVAGEVRNPQRNIPLALIGGMITVGALYIFVNLAYFYVLTPTEIASVPASSSVATEVARKFLGPLAVSLIAVALLASSFGTLHIGVLTGARVPYAMSQHRLFFQNLARLSPRTRVPVRALVVQALWACILTISGSFDALTDYSIFGLWIFYGLVTASVFIFRRKMPDAVRPYRTWGYPIVPALFLLVTAWLLGNTLWTTPRQAFAGLFLIALGLPVYHLWARHNRLTFGDEPVVANKDVLS
ncbi:MAG: APC family permease [Pyrinomonadaceae bacterium]